MTIYIKLAPAVEQEILEARISSRKAGWRFYTNRNAREDYANRNHGAANDNGGKFVTIPKVVQRALTPDDRKRVALAKAARAAEKLGAVFCTTEVISFRLPEERAAGRVRAKAARERDAEAMRPLLRSHLSRQSIGDPSCPRADNEDFPLLAVLRRDGHDHYIRTVLRYRQLVSAAEAQPLQGLDYRGNDGVEVASVSKKLDGDAEVIDAAVTGWKDEDGNPLKSIHGGEIEYTKGIRKSKGAHAIPARQAVTVNSDTYFEDKDGQPKGEDEYKAAPIGRTASLAKKFSSSALAEHIDARATLDELRGILGGLLDSFEDAALGAQTFAQIGAKNGIGPRGAISAGNVLVFRALAALDGAWHDIAVRDRKAEMRAERNVKIARKELLAANDNNYLSRAA